MNKKIIIIIFIIVSGFLVGCNIPTIPIPDKGVKPTKPFVVDDYFTSNAVFQQKKDIRLTGVSEEGVVLKATLYNNKSRIIDQNYTIVLPDSTWKITLEAPVASFDEYRIVINDNDEIYQEELQNILFGEVWLLAGEGFINKPISDEQIIIDDSLRFFKQEINGGKWLDNNQIEKISLFSYQFALKIKQYYNLPVGFILTQTNSSHLDAWLSPDLINNVNVNQFINMVNRKNCDDNDKMSFLYQQKIEPISKINISGVIFHQGITDISSFEASNDDEIKLYYQLYAKTLTHLMEEWYHLFLNECEFYLIQEPSNNLDNIVYLRNAQATGSFYYTYTTIIPTYDFIFSFDDGLLDDDIIKIAERTSLIARTKTYRERTNYLAPVYTNLIISKDQIEIEFTNISRFDKIGIIETLLVKDIDDNIIETKIEFERNWLIIKIPKLENDTFVEIGSISYAMLPDSSLGNLKNSYGVPAVPFKIIINERK